MKLLNRLGISGEHKTPNDFVFWSPSLYETHLKRSEYIEQRIKNLRRAKYKKPLQSQNRQSFSKLWGSYGCLIFVA